MIHSYFSNKDMWFNPQLKLKKKPFLIIAPHPDDDVIGCGGLMAENNSVVCYLTNGYRGFGKEKYKGKLPEIRKKESVSALRLLNAEAAFFFGLGNIITMENRKRAIDRLVAVMKHFKPKKIYVTSPFERHPTHKVATAITIRAVRIAKLKPELWGYEVWDMIREKKVDIDITDVKDKKLAAIKCHKTQSMVLEIAIAKHLLKKKDKYTERYFNMQDAI